MLFFLTFSKFQKNILFIKEFTKYFIIRTFDCLSIKNIFKLILFNLKQIANSTFFIPFNHLFFNILSFLKSLKANEYFLKRLFVGTVMMEYVNMDLYHIYVILCYRSIK